MGRRCCAYGCKETSIKGGSVSFHQFPKDPERRELWEESISRENFKATDYVHVCSKHFTADCFDQNKFGGPWLKKDATPTIFNFPSWYQYKAPIKKTLSSLNVDEINQIQGNSIENSSPPAKRRAFIGDFSEEDMESPTKAKALFSIATKELSKKAKIIKTLKQKERRLQQKLESFSKIIDDLKRNAFITENAEASLECYDLNWRIDEWYKEKKAEGTFLNPTMIKEKAVEISKELCIDDFSANEAWLYRFQKRNIGVTGRTSGSSEKNGLTQIKAEKNAEMETQSGPSSRLLNSSAIIIKQEIIETEIESSTFDDSSIHSSFGDDSSESHYDRKTPSKPNQSHSESSNSNSDILANLQNSDPSLSPCLKTVKFESDVSK